MGFSAIASSRTTHSGSFLSLVSTAVNTAVDVDTGTITAGSNWTGAIDGQAFAVIRGGEVIAVRCVQSSSGDVLTYYRLYGDDGIEQITDLQVGDTITLYEQPALVGAGTALGSVSGITLTSTGTGEQLFRRYAMGNNAIGIGGFLQIPSKNMLEFGETAPGRTMRIDAGGRLALGWYRTRGGETVFCRDLIVRGTKSESSASGANNAMLNPNDATARLDWFGGGEESGSLAIADVGGATTLIYSKNAWSRGLGATLVEPYQIRFSSENARTLGFTCENRSIVLIGNASVGGYEPRQQNMAFSFSSATPHNIWVTIRNPRLKAGNTLDVAFWSDAWARIVNNKTGSEVIVGGNTNGPTTGNRGLHEYRAEVRLSVSDVSGDGVSGRVFCRDTNHGSRLTANVIQSNPDYIADRTYESALTSGVASFDADGGVLLATARQNTESISAERFDAIVWDYRGLTNNNNDTFSFALAAYGYTPATTTVVLKGTGAVIVPYTMLADTGITSSSATAATYTDRFSIDASGNVTVTANATLDQLYDYAQSWLQASGTNMEIAGLGSKIINFSGASISLTKNVTINTGITLSSGTKFQHISTTGTITITGSIATTTYTSSAGTFVNIGVTGLTANSRIQLYNVTDASEIYNGIVAATSYSQYVQYTTDKTIRLRATYVNGVTAKQGYETTGTLTVIGLSFAVAQLDCPVYNTFAIDGSMVTGFTADYVDDEVDITLGSNFNITDLFAWWKYNEHTALGISSFFGGLISIDQANFEIHDDVVDMYLDNTTDTEIWALDNRRLMRKDGARPIKNPTSGGGGIDVEWREKVLFANSSEIAAIKVKTDNLPAIPASQGDVTSLNNLSLAQVEGSTILAKEATSQTILADTGELQTNQGNWLTATGFATPANVSDSQTAIIAEVDANEAKIDLLETKAQADASQAILVAEHDATQATLAGLNNLSLAQVEGSTVLAKEASLVTINQGVKNASILVPHATNI